ncbi:peptidase M48 [Campylobacter mucosalis]|uniref:M48 family metallopeptidase n=1 Tax=Campylobacter mucosalis TaxID=202 RepID=UPI0004D973D8|nr:M48 family metallopeptidase [Campylobacter mucosalis]KEA45212.1 peptidase M48 [Campylobacter mucosalis]QKF63864.1 peptidase, M48 family [Campylobacter mucosalis]
MKLTKILAIIFVGIFFIGCFASTTKAGLVGVDSRQLLLVSAESMNESARLSYAKTIGSAKSKSTLNTDPAMTKRVQSISAKLISQVGAFRDDALKWNWQVNVINQDTLNAWCMPGGRIVVYSGIIKRLNLTDGELAAIIGHEIAHALREHSREQASSDQLQGIGIFAISAVAGLDASSTQLLAQLAQYGISLPFSRSHETEADRIGTELMARAGYNPNEAINVWVKMNKLGGDSVPEILSTHPSNESRIADLKEVAQKVMPLYTASRK